MLNMIRNKKKHLVTAGLSILIWLVTFYTDTKIFSADGLNMNCLPIDTEMVLPMHILTKILVLLCLFGLFEFLAYACQRPSLLLPFLGFLAIYGIGLMLTWPGYYMSDDPIIFAYATRYYPVYWHNYLTSLFYMTAMSLFPASAAPVLLSDVCYAMTFAYIFYKAKQLYASKAYILLLAGILPFTLLGALMCFRPAIYASFFLFYFAYLFFAWKEQKYISPAAFGLLALLTAVLSFWRSEGMLMPVLMLPVLFFVYRKNYANIKSIFKFLFSFFLCTIALLMLIKVPQNHGEAKHYGKDYLIISTTRPLTVIVHREQTYPGAEEDLANINAITDLGYLSNDSLSCSAYNRYNTDHNEGKYTETGADAETQNAYIKSAIRLILHNPDLYLGERLQLFCVTNGIFSYDPDLVLSLKPVVSTDFHLYEHDRSYGFEMLDAYKRLPLSDHEGYALFLFRCGGEAYIPMLLLLLGITVYAIIKKNWFVFFVSLNLIAREAVIFLTAPASFIQYSYPMMYVTAVYLLLLFVDHISQKASRTKADSKASLS